MPYIGKSEMSISLEFGFNGFSSVTKKRRHSPVGGGIPKLASVCPPIAAAAPQNAKDGPMVHSIPRNFFCSSQSAGSLTFSVASETCSGRAPMIAR